MANARRHFPVDEKIPPCGVFVFESHHDVNFTMKNRQHDFLKILYIISGMGFYRVGTRKTICEAGNIIVVPIGQKHRIEDQQHQPISLYALCVAPDVWHMAPKLLPLIPTGQLEAGPALGRRIRGDLRLLLYEQTRGHVTSNVLIVGLTLQLLAQLARTARLRRSTKSLQHLDGKLAQRVALFARQCRQRFFEKIDTDQAAYGLGMSRRRFTQLFRDATGKSYVAYMHQHRIAYAKNLLHKTNHTIISIAFECGYDDLSGFYRAFAKEAGNSPYRWRQKLQKTDRP